MEMFTFSGDKMKSCAVTKTVKLNVQKIIIHTIKSFETMMSSLGMSSSGVISECMDHCGGNNVFVFILSIISEIGTVLGTYVL